MRDQVNKQKLMDWLKERTLETVFASDNLNSIRCFTYSNIVNEIVSGRFDVPEMEHINAYWAREGLINKQVQGIESLKSSLELAVKALEGIREIVDEIPRGGSKEGRPDYGSMIGSDKVLRMRELVSVLDEIQKEGAGT